MKYIYRPTGQIVETENTICSPYFDLIEEKKKRGGKRGGKKNTSKTEPETIEHEADPAKDQVSDEVVEETETEEIEEPEAGEDDA